MLTGVRPSGRLTLGNYLGAIRNFVNFQYNYEKSIIFIADLHGITSPRDPIEVQQAIEECVDLYLACGVDFTHTKIFQQSSVDEHAVLGFIIAFQCKMGELNRMTQFKLKSKEFTRDGVDVGLYIYPTLMIADILLYDSNCVPVGADQKQHIEMTRDLAQRFNKRYCEIFTVPEYYIAPIGNKILSLSDPSKKMSKSDDINDKGTIFLLDDIEITRKKIMSAVTDIFSVIKFDEERQPGISNLMSIYSSVTGMSFVDIETKYCGKGYGVFKKDVADSVCTLIEGIQIKYDYFKNEKKQRAKILENGAKFAKEIAKSKLEVVKNTLGLKLL